MKIIALSDTHDQVHILKKIVPEIRRENAELMIHCGDWVAPFTLKYYLPFKLPIKGVFGNNDGDKFRHLKIAKKIGLNVEYEERFWEFEFQGRRVAVFHGDYEGIVESLLSTNKYDVVFCGHNHIAKIKKKGRTILVNPGTLMEETSKEIQRMSYAVYNAKDNTARIIKIHSG